MFQGSGRIVVDQTPSGYQMTGNSFCNRTRQRQQFGSHLRIKLVGSDVVGKVGTGLMAGCLVFSFSEATRPTLTLVPFPTLGPTMPITSPALLVAPETATIPTTIIPTLETTIVTTLITGAAISLAAWPVALLTTRKTTPTTLAQILPLREATRPTLTLVPFPRIGPTLCRALVAATEVRAAVTVTTLGPTMPITSPALLVAPETATIIPTLTTETCTTVVTALVAAFTTLETTRTALATTIVTTLETTPATLTTETGTTTAILIAPVTTGFTSVTGATMSALEASGAVHVPAEPFSFARTPVVPTLVVAGIIWRPVSVAPAALAKAAVTAPISVGSGIHGYILPDAISHQTANAHEGRPRPGKALT